MSVDLETRLREQLHELADAMADRRLRGFEPGVASRTRRRDVKTAVAVLLVLAVASAAIVLSTRNHDSAVVSSTADRSVIVTTQARPGLPADESDLVVISPKSREVVQRIENIGIRPTVVAHGTTAYVSSFGGITECDGTPTTNWDITAFDLRTGERAHVANGAVPVVSPNGRQLAYVTSGCDRLGGLVVRDLDTGQERLVLVHDPLQPIPRPTPVAWSRDGRRLIMRFAVPTMIGNRYPNDTFLVLAPDRDPSETNSTSPVVLMQGPDDGPYDFLARGSSVWVAIVGSKAPWHPIRLVDYDARHGRVEQVLLDKLSVEGQKKNPSYTIDLLDVDADGRILFAVVPSGNVYRWTPGTPRAVLVARRGGSAAWVSP